jgi:hypothetical protein
MTLCTIDQAVLAAQKAGNDWYSAWHPQSPPVHARAQAGTLARCTLTLD